MSDFGDYNHGPAAGSRTSPGRDLVQSPQPVVVIDLSLGEDYGAPAPVALGPTPVVQAPTLQSPLVAIVRPNPQSLPPIIESSRVGDPVTVAVEESLPVQASDANLAATSTTSLGPAAMNSAEGGMIIVDDPSAASWPGSVVLANGNAQSTIDVGPDQDSLLLSILPSGWLQAIGENHGDLAHAGKNSTANRASPATVAISRPAADADEGGGIVLTIEATTLPAVISSSSGAGQELASTRPESGTWLFCDLEIADSLGLPTAAADSVESPHPQRGLGDVSMHRGRYSRHIHFQSADRIGTEPHIGWDQRKSALAAGRVPSRLSRRAAAGRDPRTGAWSSFQRRSALGSGCVEEAASPPLPFPRKSCYNSFKRCKSSTSPRVSASSMRGREHLLKEGEPCCVEVS